MMTIMAGLQQQIEQLKAQVYTGDKALDEYLIMKEDKEAFVKHLEKKFKPDDKDTKKIESK